jgi:uncharacterized membrane protein (UPF0127 family)
VKRSAPAKRLHALLLLLALAALPAGCNGERLERVRASGDLIELQVDGKKLKVELALDDPSRQRGLMFRESLPADQGMLFVWPVRQGPSKRAFWMRNCSIPLSIGFISDEGKVLQIEELQPHDEREKVSKDEVRYALEVNRGWFERNGLGPGAVFKGFPERVGGLHAR